MRFQRLHEAAIAPARISLTLQKIISGLHSDVVWTFTHSAPERSQFSHVFTPPNSRFSLNQTQCIHSRVTRGCPGESNTVPSAWNVSRNVRDIHLFGDPCDLKWSCSQLYWHGQAALSRRVTAAVKLGRSWLFTFGHAASAGCFQGGTPTLGPVSIYG